jgi:hypothetical protein
MRVSTRRRGVLRPGSKGIFAASANILQYGVREQSLLGVAGMALKLLPKQRISSS